jgi:hypothetical protein
MSSNSFLDAVIIFSSHSSQIKSLKSTIHQILTELSFMQYYTTENTSGFKTNDFVGHEGMFIVNS